MSHLWIRHITHRNESVTRMSMWIQLITITNHVNGYPWYMNESCHRSHIWMSHATHANEACHTYEWGISQVGMSHVTHRNESVTRMNMRIQLITITNHVKGCPWYMTEACHTCEWVMSQVTHMNESCHTCEWGMSHVWMRHVTHMNIMSHIEMSPYHIWICQSSWLLSQIMWTGALDTWMRHVTHMKSSCHTYECGMSHIWNRRVKHRIESYNTYEYVNPADYYRKSCE